MAVTKYLGFSVFGTPVGFEAKGNGLFERFPSLDRELYLDASDFSFVDKEAWYGVIALDLQDYGSTLIIAKWVRAKAMGSERGGGLRGAAIAFGGAQPNWGPAMRNLDSLFAQTSAFCEADGRFRVGREGWQVRLPELREADLSNLDLPDFENNGDRVAVILNSEQLLAHALEVTAGSLGLGVPRKWFFTSSQASLEKSKDQGAVYTAVLSMPLLMEHFMKSLNRGKKEAADRIQEQRKSFETQRDLERSELEQLEIRHQKEFAEIQSRLDAERERLKGEMESVRSFKEEHDQQKRALLSAQEEWARDENTRARKIKSLNDEIQRLEGKKEALPQDAEKSQRDIRGPKYEQVKTRESRPERNGKKRIAKPFKIAVLFGLSVFLTALVVLVFWFYFRKSGSSQNPTKKVEEVVSTPELEVDEPKLNAQDVVDRLRELSWDHGNVEGSLETRKEAVKNLEQLVGEETQICKECIWYALPSISHPRNEGNGPRNQLEKTSSVIQAHGAFENNGAIWDELVDEMMDAPFHKRNPSFILGRAGMQVVFKLKLNDFNQFKVKVIEEAKKQPFWEKLGWNSEEVLWEILMLYNTNDCLVNNWKAKAAYDIAIPALEEKKGPNTPAE